MTARTFAGCALVACALAAARAADAVTMLEALAAAKEHSVLAQAGAETKEKALSAPGAHTLFAPTDAAFKALEPDAVQRLASNKEELARLLRAHLVPRKLSAADLREQDGRELTTLAGTRLKVEVAADGVRVGGAKLIGTETKCGNGTVHAVGSVLAAPKD